MHSVSKGLLLILDEHSYCTAFYMGHEKALTHVADLLKQITCAIICVQNTIEQGGLSHTPYLENTTAKWGRQN